MHSLCPEVRSSWRVEGNPIVLHLQRANIHESDRIAPTRHLHCETIFICMHHITLDVFTEEDEPAELTRQTQ